MANYKAGDRNAAGLFIADIISGEETLYVLECPECNKLFFARRNSLNQIERCRDCATKRQREQVKKRKRAIQKGTWSGRASQMRAIDLYEDKPRHEEELKQFLDPRKMWERMRRQERENREAAEEREQRLIELANGRKSG